MAGNQWMIYGANGYTGRLILDHAITLGERPVVAGRREDAIRPLAEQHGVPFRVFRLDDSEATVRAMDEVGTLLLAAGPFSATSAPAISACLKTRTNYVDITGEIAVFEAAQRQDADAKAAGITLLPGAGFDVVPSDCLAMSLHKQLPEATHLTLAIAVVASPGPGTVKTAVEGAAGGGWIRRGGKLENVPAAWQRAKIPFVHRARWAMTIPWGDVSTAYWSTRIPDIEVFMATPLPAIWAAILGRPFMGLLRNAAVQKTLKRMVDRLVTGGNEAVRQAGRSAVWGRVEDSSGRRVEGQVESMETTTLTAYTAVETVARLQNGDAAPGYTTPSLAFGADFIRTFPNTHMTPG